MHDSVYKWVAEVVAEHGLAGRACLEVGSQNVNGTVRDHFTGMYLGVDMAPGPGVDMFADAETLAGLADGEWPVVVSTEMLEHCLRPWLAVQAMGRVCEPGGHVIVTARGYDERGCYGVHDYPWDVWRFSDVSMRLLASDAGLTVQTCIPDPEAPGWFLLAVKPALVEEG